MTTLADLNRLWSADLNATPWVATPDGSWTRLVGAGVNPDIPRPNPLHRASAEAGVQSGDRASTG
jgi:hypothetical protein